jgi:polyisoprenoid-binding protein YceI
VWRQLCAGASPLRCGSARLVAAAAALCYRDAGVRASAPRRQKPAVVIAPRRTPQDARHREIPSMSFRLPAPRTLAHMAAPLAAVTALALAGGAGSQQMPAPQHDFKSAPAGAYTVDPKHTAVIARVPHMGFSYSIFRFQTAKGELAWDPANPAADRLSVTIDPNSIATAPAEGFDREIADKFLKTAQFPTATFVSTAFRPQSATHGRVEGDLTVLGLTRRVVFDVDLVGAGQGMAGRPVIGVTARTELDPKVYGLPPFISGPIELMIDTEFHQ